MTFEQFIKDSPSFQIRLVRRAQEKEGLRCLAHGHALGSGPVADLVAFWVKGNEILMDPDGDREGRGNE